MIAPLSNDQKIEETESTVWFKAAPVSKFPKNAGSCIKYKEKQIAVFNFAREDKWYACQNLCPHKMEMVLSRGLIGEENTILKLPARYIRITFPWKQEHILMEIWQLLLRIRFV